MYLPKLILDVCCGSRMFWFNKKNPLATYGDIRQESHILCDGRKLDVAPDILMDFRNIPFPDKSFKLVVFDPPHMNKLGLASWMAKKYGVLSKTWEDDIRVGLNECMRVVDDYGVVIFKWNEAQVKLTKVLSIIEYMPLMGHVTGKHGRTIWMTFIKLPIKYRKQEWDND